MYVIVIYINKLVHTQHSAIRKYQQSSLTQCSCWNWWQFVWKQRSSIVICGSGQIYIKNFGTHCRLCSTLLIWFVFLVLFFSFQNLMFVLP